MAVPNELLIKLRNAFRDNLSVSEMADLCQDLGLSIDDLPGTTRNDKARELAAYIGRRDLATKLAVVGPALFSHIAWQEMLEPYGYWPKPDDGAAMATTVATTVSVEDLRELSPILANHSEFNTPGARRDMLAIAGVLAYLDVDLSGPSRQVANAVLLRLNERGQIAPGDSALGRLLSYLAADPTLPQPAQATIATITGRYGLNQKP